MTGIAAASFFSNTCRFGSCGLHFPTLADLIEHIEDNHIGQLQAETRLMDVRFKDEVFPMALSPCWQVSVTLLESLTADSLSSTGRGGFLMARVAWPRHPYWLPKGSPAYCLLGCKSDLLLRQTSL